MATLTTAQLAGVGYTIEVQMISRPLGVIDSAVIDWAQRVCCLEGLGFSLHSIVRTTSLIYFTKE